MPETRLIHRIRNMIERPEAFTRAETIAVLLDAGETIIMLQRIIARHVRRTDLKQAQAEEM